MQSELVFRCLLRRLEGREVVLGADLIKTKDWSFQRTLGERSCLSMKHTQRKQSQVVGKGKRDREIEIEIKWGAYRKGNGEREGGWSKNHLYY